LNDSTAARRSYSLRRRLRYVTRIIYVARSVLMRGQWRRRKGKYYYMEKRKNKKTIFRTKRRGRSLDLLHTFKRRRSSRRRCRSIGDDARVRRSVGRQWRQWLQVARVRVCGCVCIINVGRRCCVCRRRNVCIRRAAPVRCLSVPLS